MKKIFVLLSFIIVCFILVVNTDSATIDILSEITATITEPFTLLLFGSVLIGLANVVRKKINTGKGIEHPGMPFRADSLEENHRREGWYAGEHVTETLGNK